MLGDPTAVSLTVVDDETTIGFGESVYSFNENSGGSSDRGTDGEAPLPL